MSIKKLKFVLLLMFIFLSKNDVIISKDNIKQKNKESCSQFLVQTMDIYSGSKKLLTYFYDESQYKPYVKELFTPNGINILLDSPDDHKHHHGLMYAIKVDGVNFWEETPQSGWQIITSTSKINNKTKSNSSANGFVNEILWLASDKKKILLTEKKQIRIEPCSQFDSNLLTWICELTLPDSKKSATLTGAHYHGLGMRFIRSMDKEGRFFTADDKQGEIFRGEERLISDRWCAYTANAKNGKRVTVAMFGDPENSGGETIWFTMKVPFAYLSATMKLHESSFKLNRGDKLILQYGVALWDGEINAQRIEKMYQYWIDQIKR